MKNESEKEQEFLSGECDAIRLGGYGGTVHVQVVKGQLLVKVRRPVRRQRQYGPDSPALREWCLAIGKSVLAKTAGKRGSAPPAASAPVPFTSIGIPSGHPVSHRVSQPVITPRQIWMARLRELIGDVADNALTWGKPELLAYYEALPAGARRQVKAFDTAHGVITAARRLDRDGAVCLDVDIGRVKARELNSYAHKQLCQGTSPHTLKSYLGRFRSAVHDFMDLYPELWNKREDPTRGLKRLKTGTRCPEEIGEERAMKLMQTLQEMGEWRALATVQTGLDFGRRVGAIAGARAGLHLDAPPLTAADFNLQSDGSLSVCWRAEAQKGKGFDHGDLITTCTERMSELYVWLTTNHPNPLGPEHPLIWNPNDPTKAETYDRLNRAMGKAWVKAFDQKKPRGLAFHSLCYTLVTTLADGSDIRAAAHFTGRTVETVARIYKRVRPEMLKETARDLDKIRRKLQAHNQQG